MAKRLWTVTGMRSRRWRNEKAALARPRRARGFAQILPDRLELEGETVESLREGTLDAAVTFAIVPALRPL